MKIRIEGVVTAGLFFLLSVFTFRGAYDYTLARLLAVDFIVCILALFFLIRRQSFRLPLPVLLSFTAFVFSITVAVAFSTFPAATQRELPHVLIYFFLFLLGSQMSFSSFSLTAWFLAVLTLCGIALKDYFGRGTIVTPLGNKNFFAGYLLLILPLAITLFGAGLLNWKPANKRHKTGGTGKKSPFAASQRRIILSRVLTVLLFCIVILFVVLLFLADSQASQAGLFFSLLFLAVVWFIDFLLPRFSLKIRRVFWVIAILGLLTAGLLGVKKGVPYIRQNVRFPLWQGSAAMLKEKPWSGFGPGTFLAGFQRFRPNSYYNFDVAAPLSDHSHSEYLELGSECGVPVLLTFVIFLGVIFWMSFKRRRLDYSRWPFSMGLLGGVAAILFDGFFSTNLRTFSVVSLFWFLLGICVSEPSLDVGRVKGGEGKKINAKVRKAGISEAVWITVILGGIFSGAVLFQEIRGQVYYKRGIAAREAENWSEAILNYRKAVQMDPANLQAFYKMAFVYASAGDAKNAIRVYHDILRVSPNFAKTYYNLALLSIRLGNKEDALNYLILSLKYNSYDTDSQNLLKFIGE
ncbi:MAG: O-antigen ligase family protein [Candidatus Omnitrophota bacterium]